MQVNCIVEEDHFPNKIYNQVKKMAHAYFAKGLENYQKLHWNTHHGIISATQWIESFLQVKNRNCLGEKYQATCCTFI